MATKWENKNKNWDLEEEWNPPPPPPLKKCLKCALNIQQNHMWHKPTHWCPTDWPTDRPSDCSQSDNKVTWPQKHSSSFDWILSALFVPAEAETFPTQKTLRPHRRRLCTKVKVSLVPRTFLFRLLKYLWLWKRPESTWALFLEAERFKKKKFRKII